MLRSDQDLEAAIHWFHIFRFAERPETGSNLPFPGSLRLS